MQDRYSVDEGSSNDHEWDDDLGISGFSKSTDANYHCSVCDDEPFSDGLGFDAKDMDLMRHDGSGRSGESNGDIDDIESGWGCDPTYGFQREDGSGSTMRPLRD